MTIKSPQLSVSFNVIEEFCVPPSSNDILTFTLIGKQYLCRISHLIHYCGDGAACLVVLDDIIVDSDEQHLAATTAFHNKYVITNIVHREELPLYSKVCKLIGHNPQKPLFTFADQGELQEFTKLIGETFRCLLISELTNDINSINITSLNTIIVSLHNMLLDNKESNSGSINLRDTLTDFDKLVNDGRYKWDAKDEIIIDISKVIFEKANIPNLLFSSKISIDNRRI